MLIVPGEDWEELKEHNKRSAGILLSGGSGFCSGALINNTANDGTPYFLTANHCYSNPANWAFRFGWISPDPVCATTANSTNGPTNMTLSGATLRARDAGSDFALVEINQAILKNGIEYLQDGINLKLPLNLLWCYHPAGDIMSMEIMINLFRLIMQVHKPGKLLLQVVDGKSELRSPVPRDPLYLIMREELLDNCMEVVLHVLEQ